MSNRRVQFLVAVLIASTVGVSQESVNIPLEHVELKQDTTIAGGAGVFLICPNHRVKVLSGLHRIYVMDGSAVEVHGGSPTVFAMHNSEVAVMAGTPRLILSNSSALNWSTHREQSGVKRSEFKFSLGNEASCWGQNRPMETDTVAVEEIAQMEDTMVVEPIIEGIREELKSNQAIGLLGRLKGKLMDSDTIQEITVKKPSQLIGIKGDSQLTVFKEDIELRSGNTVVTGEKNTIYVHQDAILELFGGSNTIYAFSGSKLILSGQESNRVVMEPDVTIEYDIEGEKLEIEAVERIIF